jgi:hypothetical protein
MKPRIAKSMPQHVRPKREGMDRDHLKNVRELLCLICDPKPGALDGTWKVHAHHLRHTGRAGTGLKSPDKDAVPLCWAHHDARSPYDSIHKAGDEDAYFRRHGIDGRAVASALWAVRGDLEGMRRVIFRARQDAALKLKAHV